MTDKDEATKKHREEAVETLHEMRTLMVESENWENLKRFIYAVTMGAFALARLNEIDFGEDQT